MIRAVRSFMVRDKTTTGENLEAGRAAAPPLSQDNQKTYVPLLLLSVPVTIGGAFYGMVLLWFATRFALEGDPTFRTVVGASVVGAVAIVFLGVGLYGVDLFVRGLRPTMRKKGVFEGRIGALRAALGLVGSIFVLGGTSIGLTISSDDVSFSDLVWVVGFAFPLFGWLAKASAKRLFWPAVTR